MSNTIIPTRDEKHTYIKRRIKSVCSTHSCIRVGNLVFSGNEQSPPLSSFLCTWSDLYKT